MSQGIWGTIVPSSTSGNQLATYLNDFKNAVVSGFSGTSRPANLNAGGYWIDTTNEGSPNYTWAFKVWTGTLDVTVFNVNLSTGLASISNTDTSFQISKISEDAIGPILYFLKERTANNGQTLNGDSLGEIHVTAAASDNSNPTVAKFKFVATEDATATNAGGYWSIEMVPTGQSALAEVARFIDGKLGLGATSPSNTLHVKGDGVRSERESNDTTASQFISRKKRLSGGGQVQSGDKVGQWRSNSTDNGGSELSDVVVFESYALENHTTTARGTGAKVKVTGVGEATSFEALDIKKSMSTFYSPLTVTDLYVTNLYSTNYYEGTVTQLEDPQIELNIGGTEATAQASKAGIKVKTDTTDFVVAFDNTKASELVAGRVGSEKEIINVDSVQSLSNKTLVTLKLDQRDEATAASVTTLSATKAIVRFTGSTATNLHGIDASSGTKVITIYNGSTANVTLKNQSATETTATNRLSIGADVVVAPASSYELFYETNTGRWVTKSGSGTGSGGGGGFGVGAVWRGETGNSPLFDYEFNQEVMKFESADIGTVAAHLWVKVPNSYLAGTSISMKLLAYGQSSALNYRFRAVSTLIRAGTDAVTSTTNQNSSDSADITQTLAYKATALEFTLAPSGLINSVAVSPGDLILVKLTRIASGGTDDTLAARIIPSTTEVL